jgi:predicted dehydrogenase
MNVAIVGCGLIGMKRALALGEGDRLVACCDTNQDARDRFAKQFHCDVYADYGSLLARSTCDAVVVAVVNKYAKDIVIEALSAGKHVLAEKPLGKNVEEARQMIKHSSSQIQFDTVSRLAERVNNAGASHKPVLKTGFNHRFHRALMAARQRVECGDIGTILTIRARYGHGGRPGMEKEWRASKDLCGGGELLDQGVHLIDLIRWFGGEIESVFGKVETRFWEIEVEDSAFAILTTSKNVTAMFHVSWFNWKNIFSFEIFGSDGYVRIDGLGGSYGPETLEFGKRKKEGGKPDVQVISFPSEDVSWSEEWKEFKGAIQECREPLGNGYDGMMANAVIQRIYDSSRERRELSLKE